MVKYYNYMHIFSLFTPPILKNFLNYFLIRHYKQVFIPNDVNFHYHYHCHKGVLRHICFEVPFCNNLIILHFHFVNDIKIQA
jgi:hypothetical protein